MAFRGLHGKEGSIVTALEDNPESNRALKCTRGTCLCENVIAISSKPSKIFVIIEVES